MSGEFAAAEINARKEEHAELLEERDRLSEDILFKLKMNPTFITDQEIRKQLDRLHWLDVSLGQSRFVRLAAHLAEPKRRRFSVVRLLLFLVMFAIVVVATATIIRVAEQQWPILREWPRIGL